MQELDPRVVKLSIEVNGQIKTYEGLAIAASGTKYANANQNECEVTIYNLLKSTRDYILTETTPFNKNKTPKSIVLEAGRKSYGVTNIFSGNIITAVPSQPPDIGVTLKCLTANYQGGNVLSSSLGGVTPLSTIAKQTANALGMGVRFEATDKQISNYNYSGSAVKQVDAIGDVGGVSAYIDDNMLVVQDINIPLSNSITIVNSSTGMVGIPELTEQGVKITYLLDNHTTLGGRLQVTSKINPAANGNYAIYKLGFEIANRDTPFYWVAEGKRL